MSGTWTSSSVLARSALEDAEEIGRYKARATIDDSLRRSASARSVLDQSFRSVQTSITETNASLDAERERGMMLVSQRVDTEKKITETEALRRKLTIDLARLKNQLQSTIQRVQMDRIKRDSALFEAANNSLNASRKRLQLAKEKEHTANAKLLRVQAEYEEASKQESEVKQKADKQNEKLQDVKNEIKQLKINISKFKSDTRALTVTKNSMEDTLDMLTETLNELKERVVTKKTEISTLKTSQTFQINDMHSEIKTLRGELNDIVNASEINQNSSNIRPTGSCDSSLFDSVNDTEYGSSFNDSSNNGNNSKLFSLRERRTKEEAEVQKLIQTSNKLADMILEKENEDSNFKEQDIKELEQEVLELKNRTKEMQNQINTQKTSLSASKTSSKSSPRPLLQNFTSNISAAVQESLQELPRLLDDFATSQTEPREKIRELQEYWEKLKAEKTHYNDLLKSILEDTKRDVDIFKKRYIAQNGSNIKPDNVRKVQESSDDNQEHEDLLRKRLEATLEYEKELKERIEKAKATRAKMVDKVEVLQKELDRLLEEERKCREEMRSLQTESAKKEEAYKQQILRLSQSLKHYQRLEEESKNSFSDV